jgi:class 3 adenylate cyclase
VTVADKVRDKAGNIEAVLGYNVPLEAFRNMMPEIKILETVKGTIFSIFMRDGRYVIRSDDEQMSGRLGKSEDDLHVRMRQALSEDKTSWRSFGKAQGSRWYGEFQKSRYGDLYVSLEIPLAAGMWPIIKLGRTYLLLGLASLVVLSVILIKMAKKIAQPVSMLSEAAIRLSQGDYGEKLPVVTKDELGHLTETFNNMTEGLRQRDFIRDTFGRYVTTEVVDRLLESEDGLKLGGENREISIIMSDLRGFTAHTAEIPPEKVLFILNRYLGKMVEILLDHRAVIDEIIGDGILAFFGAPADMEDHPARAVACALQMQAAMEHINTMNEADGFPCLEMGIGVNTGRVIVGNIGSERRTKYGVVGSVVNFTGRIESYTVGGQILVSQHTYERVKAMISVRDVIDVQMKGMPGSVKLYDVRAIEGAYNIVLPHLAEAPIRLRKKIAIRIRRVDEKVVTQSHKRAWITRLSQTGAIVASEGEMQAYQDIRMEVPQIDGQEGIGGEAFAKVLSVTFEDGLYQALVRFTFVAPEIRLMFGRELIQH